VKACKDCTRDEEVLDLAPRKPARPIVQGSGGRCATHWRKEKARRKLAAHEARVQKVYGLKPGGYGALYRHQDGVCAICRRATGATRSLSVDHDHKSGLTRGLLCRPCNDLLGHLRDDPEAAQRVANYLVFPPARALGIVAIHEDFRKER
jgi:hypothetical protein